MSQLKDLIHHHSSRKKLLLVATEKAITSGLSFKINILNYDVKKSFYRVNSSHRRFKENIGQLAHIIDKIFLDRVMKEPYFNKFIKMVDFGDNIDSMVLCTPPLFLYPLNYNFENGDYKISSVDFEVNGEKFSSYNLSTNRIINSIDYESKLNHLELFSPTELDIKIKYNLSADTNEYLEWIEERYDQYISRMKDTCFQEKIHNDFKDFYNSAEFLHIAHIHPELYRIFARYSPLGYSQEKHDIESEIHDLFNKVLNDEDINRLIEHYKSGNPFVGDLTFGKTSGNIKFK